MKVSIVTISFNQAKYLRECMDSVLNQSHLNIEYIVVDPGSTDGSRDIINSYGDRVIRVYEKDFGPADGLNRGFKNATGEIYCYLNSDDVFLPGAIRSVSKFFQKHGNVDVLCGHGKIIDSKSHVKRNIYSDKFTIMSAAYGVALSVQPSTFFRRDIFIKIGGFNIDNQSNWDGELLIDMALAGARIEVVDEYLSNYRVHGESITGSGCLVEYHDAYERRMFEKIMARPFQGKDVWLKFLFRLRKHLLNPRATFERLKYGPVFGSEK